MRTYRKLCHGLLVLAVVSGAASTRAQPAAGPEPAVSPTAAPGVPAKAPSVEEAASGAAEKPWNRGVPLATRQAASKLFDEGYRLLGIPLFARAAEKFQEALALYQHPAIHFNLALAQLNLVQPVEAYESFGRAMAHGAEPIGDVPYAQAAEYRRRLELQLGHVEVTCEQPGAAVTMDGRPLFTGPGRWQGVVVPGEHQILASADGFIPAAERVVVSAGERAAVALALQRPARTVTERYLPAWIPWASLGVGAGLLGAGGYMDRQSGKALDVLDMDLRDECSRGCTEEEAPRLLARHAELAREQSRARLLYVAGGAVVATSAVLLYLNRERVIRRETRAESISMQPIADSHTLGITARMSF